MSNAELKEGWEDNEEIVDELLGKNKKIPNYNSEDVSNIKGALYLAQRGMNKSMIDTYKKVMAGYDEILYNGFELIDARKVEGAESASRRA